MSDPQKNSEARPMKAHKVELLIVDFDRLGAEEIELVIENARYPNRCISPRVASIKTVDVDWDDDHPLNQTASWREAFAEIFGSVGSPAAPTRSEATPQLAEKIVNAIIGTLGVRYEIYVGNHWGELVDVARAALAAAPVSTSDPQLANSLDACVQTIIADAVSRQEGNFLFNRTRTRISAVIGLYLARAGTSATPQPTPEDKANG